MRKLLRKIIEILDGTPAEYGKHQAGQSLIEMAFITPLLIILIAGLIEIAWLANNYLILQEVTRVGARRGTVLAGDNSPLAWNNAASLVPRSLWDVPVGEPSYDPFLPTEDEPTRVKFHDATCNGAEQDFGFYNLITCTMFRSMDPLELKRGIDPKASDGSFYPDDIIVSAFALQAIDNPTDLNFGLLGLTEYPTGKHVYVIGRYPTNANECTVSPSGDQIEVERDPFDYITDGTRNCTDIGGGTCGDNPNFLELVGMDGGLEYERGFAWTGQHKVQVDDYNPTPVDCIGSQWTIERLESVMNLPDFHLNDAQRQFLPSEGLVLVEMYWQHHLFLAFPFFSPIYDMLGSQTTITTWAAFPAPSVEPNIDYHPVIH